jgi:hypothetical protein
MASSLRPDLIIRQVFRAAQATVPTANNPAVLVGLNRQLVYRAYAGTFQTNAEYADYAFPGLISGAVVEPNTSAVDSTIRPKVYLSTSYGVADVTSYATFNLGVTPPTFDLSPTTTAIFDTVTGSTGNYNAVTGYFTDPSADFVTDQVAANDIISVNGRQAFTVSSVVDDTTLSVDRIDRGPDDSKVSISAATGLYRTLTYTGDAGTVYDGFVTEGVRAGDIVTVQGWDGRQIIGNKLSFTAADSSGVRTITFSGSVTAKVGDLVYLSNDLGVKYPAFMLLTSGTGTGFSAVAVSPTIADSDIAGSAGKPQRAYELYKDGIETVRNTVIAATVVGDAGSRTISGTFSSPAADDLVICSDRLVRETGVVLDNTAKTVTAASGTPFSAFKSGDKVVVLSGTAFVNRLFSTIVSVNNSGAELTLETAPVAGTSTVIVMSIRAKVAFKVTSGTSSSLVVTDIYGNDVPTYLPSSGMPANALVIDGVAAAASIAKAQFTLSSGVWTMNLDSAPGTALAVNDLVFSQTGILLFKITAASSTTLFTVVPDTKAGLTYSASFALPVVTAKPTPAELIVTKVVGETSVVVKDTAGIITSTGTAYDGLRTTIEVADALEDVNYQVRKVVSSLVADVLVSFASVRNDHAGELIEVNADTVESILGPAVPHNPLGFAAAAAVSNTTVPVYCAQVSADTSSGWTNAINLIKTSQVYSVAPLTQNETYLGLFRAHVELESQPENKRERILFQSHRQESQITRYTWAAAALDTAKFVCTSASATPTITWSTDKGLPALGVIPGDLVSFEYFGQVADKGFVSGSVSDMRVVSVSTSGDSTLTLLRRSTDPITLTGGVVLSSITIKSKPLSATQVRDAIAAYPATIKNRRFRNVYPDRCLVTFSDVTNPNDTSVGIYGGGTVANYEVGGWYPASILAAMRSSIPASATLTRRPFSGVQRLVQGGGSADTDLDKILDGGNFVLVQLAGDNSNVEAIRAVTTDVTQLNYLEESVTTQVDNLARRLRKQISPIIGSTILDRSFFDLFSVLSGAVIKDVISNKEMREIVLVSVTEDPVRADTFLVSYQVRPYYTAAHADITIYI